MSSLPTKKQRELLEYIGEFIATYGYSPSYREIKSGLSYGSVATVAKHVDNLVTKGLITKRRHSARSLEPTSQGASTPVQLKPKQTAGQKWLIDAVDARFRMVEGQPRRTQKDIDGLTVLVAGLRVLGLDGAFSAFQARLTRLSAGRK
jgi:SOS-response transcriptional repressor LexA